MIDLGKQGGDVSSDVKLDLSSCVNPYGPAPSALQALFHLDSAVVKHHPYKAASNLEAAYARLFNVDCTELIATRGASEAIWHLAKVLQNKRIILPLPTYTEYLKAFINVETYSADTLYHTADQLNQAACNADVIVLSNPHNPTGRYIDKSELLAVANANPQCLFVVDESYSDFVGSEISLIGSNSKNIIVFRSPTKFYGIGGVRVGVIWTKSAQLHKSLTELRTTWPLSNIETTIAIAAMNDHNWANEMRIKLAQDGVWLEETLSKIGEIKITAGPLHFRLVTGEVEPLYQKLMQAGVAVRKFDAAHGVGVSALRIAAPVQQKREYLTAVLF